MLPLGIIPTIITLPVLADVLTGCGHPRLGHPSQENYQDALFLATCSKKIWTLVQKIVPKYPNHGPDHKKGPGSHGQEVKMIFLATGLKCNLGSLFVDSTIIKSVYT